MKKIITIAILLFSLNTIAQENDTAWMRYIDKNDISYFKCPYGRPHSYIACIHFSEFEPFPGPEEYIRAYREASACDKCRDSMRTKRLPDSIMKLDTRRISSHCIMELNDYTDEETRRLIFWYHEVDLIEYFKRLPSIIKPPEFGWRFIENGVPQPFSIGRFTPDSVASHSDRPHKNYIKRND